VSTIDINVPPREIQVTRTEIERTGRGARGPWTLYRVYATEADGTAIADVLKTFDPLPLGAVTVTQEAFVKDGAIQHYTLKDTSRKRRSTGGDDQRIADLEARVTTLEAKLNAFIRAFPELES
jgi:hypothetical protein